jgi:hypothetical protein
VTDIESVARVLSHMLACGEEAKALSTSTRGWTQPIERARRAKILRDASTFVHVVFVPRSLLGKEYNRPIQQLLMHHGSNYFAPISVRPDFVYSSLTTFAPSLCHLARVY